MILSLKKQCTDYLNTFFCSQYLRNAEAANNAAGVNME